MKNAEERKHDMSTLTVGKSNFEHEVLSSELPVLIDFWAPWCAPCRMLSPVVDEVSETNSHKAKFVKINVDDEPELAQKFQVSSIPMLVLVKDGKVVSSSVGAQPKAVVEQMLR
jgi:thioredoxin 1